MQIFTEMENLVATAEETAAKEFLLQLGTGCKVVNKNNPLCKAQLVPLWSQSKLNNETRLTVQTQPNPGVTIFGSVE